MTRMLGVKTLGFDTKWLKALGTQFYISQDIFHTVYMQIFILIKHM